MTVARLSISSLNRGPSKKRTVLAGNDPILSGAFESIQTVNVGSGGSASISFTSIPSTYKHLQIRVFGRSSKTTELNDAIAMRFNGDTFSNYRSHTIQAQGSGTPYAGTNTGTYAFLGYVAGDQGTANVFGGAVIDILDYTSTNKNKTIRCLAGNDRNDSGLVDFTSGLWFNTPAAITQIDIFPTSGTTWKQYSHFALYGIR